MKPIAVNTQQNATQKKLPINRIVKEDERGKKTHTQHWAS